MATIRNRLNNNRTQFIVWFDYLIGNNGSGNDNVADENGELIAILTDSGYEQINNNTPRTSRTPI